MSSCAARHKKNDSPTSGIGWVIGGILLIAACLYYNIGDAGSVSPTVPVTVAPELVPTPEAAPEPIFETE